MLRYVTEKLQSYTLEDIQNDADRDSGTESDDEVLEINADEVVSFTEEENGSVTAKCDSSGSSHRHFSQNSPIHSVSKTVSPAPDESTVDDLSCTSDFENCGFDFDRNSSEDELSVIDQLRQFDEAKHKHFQDGLACDSTASTDDEVQQLLLPNPLIFRKSPPIDATDARKQPHFSPLSQVYITSITAANTISPRKRTRQTSLSDSADEDQPTNSAQRPSLDFEKMQKTLVKKHCTQSLARSRIVRVRTVNTTVTRARCLYRPEICTFRSISMSPFNHLAATAVDTAPFAF